MEEKILRIFVARGAEAKSSEMLTILSWWSLPLPSFLSKKHGETEKSFAGRLCLWSSAESVNKRCDCMEHNQESHRGALKGRQMPAVVRDKVLQMGTHKKSAQGNKYEAFSTLEHSGDSGFQKEHVLVLLCMLDNSGTVLRTQSPGSWLLCETPWVTFASQPGRCFGAPLFKQSKKQIFSLKLSYILSLSVSPHLQIHWQTPVFPDSLPKGMLHLWRQLHISVQVN